MSRQEDPGDNAGNVDDRLDQAERPDERWNFATLLMQGTSIDLGRIFASPKLVIPFLYIAVGAPAAFAGLLIPIVQVARMASQMASAPLIASAGVRKWYMILGLVIMTAGLGIVAVAVDRGEVLYLALLFLVVAVILGIGQGIQRLAFQTMLSHVMPRERQHSLLLLQQVMGGILAIVVALITYLWLDHDSVLASHLSLLWVGMAAFGMAAVTTMLIREVRAIGDVGPCQAAAEGGIRSYGDSVLQGVRLVRSVRWFRRYCLLRCLLLSVELATPFYAIHAALTFGKDDGTLHIFLIATSLGMMASGLIWQRHARRPLRYSLALAALIATVAAVVAIVMGGISGFQTSLGYALVFFLVAVAAQGTLVARKVYLLTVAPRGDVAYYVAVSDAMTGAVAIGFASVLGTLAQVAHAAWPIVILLVLNLATAVYAMALPTEEMAAAET